MSWFEYEGLTHGGTAMVGRIEAPSLEQARNDLDRMGIELRQINPAVAPPKHVAGLNEDDFIFFNEQLASLAQAGIALDEGLAQMARDLSSSRLKRWIEALVADLRRGVPIDQAIASREAGLPILYSRVIRAGIASGELPATLLNLNQHLRMAGSTRRLIWELVSYPLLVGFFAMTLFSLFMMLIVPQFKEIFKDFGANMPQMTLAMLSFSEWFTHGHPPGWVVIWGTPIVLYLLWHFIRVLPGGFAMRERIVMAIPAVGQVHRASLVARFLRSVATAISTGIPLPQAVRLSADATGSTMLRNDAEHVAGEVEHGHPIFVACQSTRIIPPMFGFCVQVATGREALPNAIAQLSRSYENRAVHMQTLVLSFVFPLSIILLGAFMFFGISGLFLPLVSLINSVSGGS